MEQERNSAMARIDSFVQPQRLYRYRLPKDLDRELEAIEEGYLFSARYLDMNDPMEGLFVSGHLLREHKHFYEIREAIVSAKSQIGICSFSDVYDHELMWAHYASDFTGICVSYSVSHLLKNLADDITFVRMYYNEKVPTVHRPRMEVDQLAKMVLSNKNYRWLYEREWRMFARPGKIRYGDKSCVTHVYLGFRMKPHDRERVKNKLLPLLIKVSEMTINKYSISFKTNRQS
jgi:hypothetical protein